MAPSVILFPNKRKNYSWLVTVYFCGFSNYNEGSLECQKLHAPCQVLTQGNLGFQCFGVYILSLLLYNFLIKMSLQSRSLMLLAQRSINIYLKTTT